MDSWQRDLRVIKNILNLGAAILILWLFTTLKPFLVPLAFALFLVMLAEPIIRKLTALKVPGWISTILLTVSIFGVIYSFGAIIMRTGKQLSAQSERLLVQINQKLDGILGIVNDISGQNLDSSQFIDILRNIFNTEWVIAETGKFAGAISGITGHFILTILYFVILISGIMKYEAYLDYLADSKESKLRVIFREIKGSIVTYIKIKFIMSLCTGTGFYLISLIFGLDFPLFWGFLAFALNFIPTIGSAAATLPPILLGLITFDSVGLVFVLALCLLAVQFLFGNIIEPRYMGSKVALNTIMVIFGLLFWGYLWGVTGMFLSVPLTVLTKVILSNIPSAQILVRLMGPGQTNEK